MRPQTRHRECCCGLKKCSENTWANENLSCGFPSIPAIAPGVAPRIVTIQLWLSHCTSRGKHSENGISHSENYFLNSESCAENTPELSESSENGLSLRERFSWNWGGPQASEELLHKCGNPLLMKGKRNCAQTIACQYSVCMQRSVRHRIVIPYAHVVTPCLCPPCFNLSEFRRAPDTLSGSLNRLNAILSLLQPLDRYRTISAVGRAIGRPYLALSRIPTQEFSTASF